MTKETDTDMKKSTTALTLAALLVAGGIYGTSSALTSAFAAEAAPTETQISQTDAGLPVYIAIPHPTSSAVPGPSLDPVRVDDERDIRCYYRADLTSEYQVAGSSESPRPPFMTTGIEEVGFDAANNPTPEDPSSGLLQVSDPINQCSRVWDIGGMILEGINDDLVPAGFVSPPFGVPAESTSVSGAGKDQNGNPLYPDPSIRTFGNFIPFLTECVVDGKVSVIPGTAEVCNDLGIPGLSL
jgi:hypothetical protein